jgi:hypothetical protein
MQTMVYRVNVDHLSRIPARPATPFDDLSLRLKILVGLTAPPILTVLCWLVSRHWAGSQRGGTRFQNGAGF